MNTAKGAISKPIKTNQGWDIIKLLDKRDPKPMNFDDIKDKVEQDLIQRNMQAYISSVLDKVNVELVTQ